jgi:hypothetical protein
MIVRPYLVALLALGLLEAATGSDLPAGAIQGTGHTVGYGELKVSPKYFIVRQCSLH